MLTRTGGLAKPGRTHPAETKLVICVWHPLSLWNPPPEMAARIRGRWPEMQIVHLPNYEGLGHELPDTDIFVGLSLRPAQFAVARKLKWIHSTAAAVGQLMYPELRSSGIEVTNASGVHRVPMAEHILGHDHRSRAALSRLHPLPATEPLGAAGTVGRNACSAPAARTARSDRAIHRLWRDRPRSGEDRTTSGSSNLGCNPVWQS